MESLFIGDNDTDVRNDLKHILELVKKSRTAILYELLTNTASAPLSKKEAELLSLQADSYQIVICETFNKQSLAAPYSFTELLKAMVNGRDINGIEHMIIDGKDVVLLRGTDSINELSYFLKHIKKQPPQDGSPLSSLFLAYGRPVYSLEEIHLSYEDASTLLEYRFFCTHKQHTLGYEELIAEPNCPPRHAFLQFDEKLLADFVNYFISYIESFNRKMIAKALSELEAKLLKSSHNADSLKLFLTDLYLQIKEKMNRNYASSEIPFKSNAFVIEYIYSRNFLYEIIDFLTEQFDMIITAIRNPSIDTVIDNVLFYIDHNYTNNIKLETIAQLFGYNNAYLGKIFYKSTGVSFNTYIDHKRIEYSKQLILENKLKVYEIAKEAGFRNVDYFHKKFKKYVGKSPTEYRKQMND